MKKLLNLFLYNTVIVVTSVLPVLCYIVLYRTIQPGLVGEILLLIVVLPITISSIVKLYLKLKELYVNYEEVKYYNGKN